MLPLIRVLKTRLRLSIVGVLCAVFTLCIAGCDSEQKTSSAKPHFPLVTAQNLFAVDALDQHHAWMVGFNSTIVHTADAGETWETQTSGVTAPLCDVSFVNPKTGWISGRVGTILHTEDGGKNWKQQESGTTRHLFGLIFVDELSGWAAGEFGTILHTGDGGKTWIEQGSREDRIYNDVCFVDQQHGWVVGGGGTIVTTQSVDTQVKNCQEPSSSALGFSLQQNFPNPFNLKTTIAFYVPETRVITLKIYDILGRETSILMHETREPGHYSVTWNSEDHPSGIYLLQMKAGKFMEMRKMVLQK